jgi:hypothetical protein
MTAEVASRPLSTAVTLHERQALLFFKAKLVELQDLGVLVHRTYNVFRRSLSQFGLDLET